MSKRYTIDELLLKLNDMHGDKYIYYIDDYINNKQKIKIYCKQHNEYFLQRIDAHIRGQGCPLCGPQKMTNDKFKEISINNHDIEYDYSLSEYLSCDDKICIICKEHGLFYQKPYNHMNGQNCPKCKNKSNGENRIKKILDKYSIEYESQKRFMNCIDKRTLPFDFYIPLWNMIIEYDGRQHKYDSYSIYDFDMIKKHDDIKDEYCKNNNIKLIRINHKDYNNLENEIIKIINEYDN
jgi:very-short-patch-repair endonuclease